MDSNERHDLDVETLAAMTDDRMTVAPAHDGGESGEAGFDVLLDLLATVADRVETLDVLTGEGADAQENRTIRGSRAHLARAEARQVRAEVGEVRRRARALARAAHTLRDQSTRLALPSSEDRPRDRETLTATRAADQAARAAGRDERRQRLVEGARHVAPGVCWAQLAVLRQNDLVTWSAGESLTPDAAALTAGLRADILAGADSVLVGEGDERWPAVAPRGVGSVLALAAGPGALVLVSSEAATFDDAARVVASQVAACAGSALAVDDTAHPSDDTATRPSDETRAVLDAACAVLGRSVGVGSESTFETLLAVSRATDEPVLVAAERVLAALVLRASDADEVAEPVPAVLRRAVGYIEDHALEVITTEDIASAAGIGSRGLQQLFRRHRGLTPTQYVRHVRLDRAHAELVDADPSSLTVATVAARWHFGNPGRFSVAYRERFGTSPSRTLRA